MWTLVVIALNTGGSSTYPSLDACRQQFKYEAMVDEGIREAYCINPSGDRVQLARDGKIINQ
jgi:hypothetical protein